VGQFTYNIIKTLYNTFNETFSNTLLVQTI